MQGPQAAGLQGVGLGMQIPTQQVPPREETRLETYYRKYMDTDKETLVQLMAEMCVENEELQKNAMEQRQKITTLIIEKAKLELGRHTGD